MSDRHVYVHTDRDLRLHQQVPVVPLLMIDHNNWFVPVQFFSKPGGGFSSFMNLFCEGGIFASDYVD